MRIAVALFLLATCYAQDPDAVEVQSSQSAEVGAGQREPLFFYTLTLTVTSTFSTSTVVTSTTANLCSTAIASPSGCTGKRRRRGILTNPEDYEEYIVKPSPVEGKEADTQVVAIQPETVSRAEERVEPVKIETSPVYEVESTQAPVAEVVPKRQAREAQFFYDSYLNPLMPTYGAVSPRFNPYVRMMSPYFRQGSPNAIYPSERFLLSMTTTTVTSYTSTSTSWTTMGTSSITFSCTLPTSFAACG